MCDLGQKEADARRALYMEEYGRRTDCAAKINTDIAVYQTVVLTEDRARALFAPLEAMERRRLQFADRRWDLAVVTENAERTRRALEEAAGRRACETAFRRDLYTLTRLEPGWKLPATVRFL